jgi:hypothetical protein
MKQSLDHLLGTWLHNDCEDAALYVVFSDEAGRLV